MFMMKRTIFSLLAGLLMAIAPVSSAWGFQIPMADYIQVNIGDFQPSIGDYLVVNLDDGKGYLINENSRIYGAFPVLSGQRRTVRYLGRTYFAATPERTWVIKEKNIQGDKVTFSKSGTFLRMYSDGKRTPYGIHGHKYFQEMLGQGNSFRSMGCILVADDIVPIVEQSFLENGKELKVITVKNPRFAFLL